jgi:hypothetical protein
MKTPILILMTLSAALAAYAQGTVIFNNRVGGTSHVYAPLSPTDNVRIVGQGSNDSQPAGVDYGGRVPVGASGLNAQYGGFTTLAQLLGAPGFNAPESSLTPQIGPSVFFRTGTASGGTFNATATFSNIPKDAPAGSFEMVAWDNFSGLYPSWAEASVAWQAGLIAAGKSPEFNLTQIGGDINVPQTLFNDQNGAPGNGGVQSFNLYFIPEPSAAALFGLGAAAITILRRLKSET